MCHGVEYFREGQRVLVYFDVAHAELPVRKRSGAIEFVTWGARGERYLSDDNTPGYLLKFPVGGWAARGSILAGAWEKFEPRPVRIVASRFVFNHAQLGPLFFALDRGEYIQGLLAQAALQRRVYVVTVPAPPEHADRLDEWPRVIKSRHRVRP
jgi:hypothetical protein